jgi:hypothetical protein
LGGTALAMTNRGSITSLRLLALLPATSACAGSTSAQKGHGAKEIAEVIPKTGVRKCIDAIVSKETCDEPENNQEAVEQAEEKTWVGRTGGRRGLCSTALNEKCAKT